MESSRLILEDRRASARRIVCDMLDCEKLKHNYIRIDICVLKLSDIVSEKKKTFRSSFLIILFPEKAKNCPTQ